MSENYVRGGELDLRSDLQIGAMSITLTLSNGTGSIPIPNNCTLVGVKPISSNSIRVGLEPPESDGTKTGVAAATDLKKGIPIDGEIWTWFNIGFGKLRTLYFKGGTSDVLEIAVT